MSIFSVTAHEGLLQSPDMPQTDVRLPLARALAQVPDHAPTLILVHGYSHHPHLATANPARHIYATREPQHPEAISWPLALGYGGNGPAEGLCIPFAWPGCVDGAATLVQRLNRFTTVYDRAAETGEALARLITWIKEIAPDRPTMVLAHSLGARCVFAAAHRLPARSIDRVVLLGAAAFASEAETMLRMAPAARDARIFNILSRQNDLFDLAFEWLAPRARWSDRALGRGLRNAPPKWLDVQLDHPDLGPVLGRHGIGLAAARSTISHRDFYLRPGAMRFYRHILCDAGNRQIARLSDDLATLAHQPMGTRIWRALADQVPQPRSGPGKQPETP